MLNGVKHLLREAYRRRSFVPQDDKHLDNIIPYIASTYQI